ncbi:CC056 protein, partial [Crocuta crocuta]
MAASASLEADMWSMHPETQILEEAHVTLTNPALWTPVYCTCGFFASPGAQAVADPTPWAVTGAPCAVHAYSGCPGPWSYTWVPIGSPLCMGPAPLGAPVPSVGPWGFPSFDPAVGSQCLATMASMGPPPPYSSVPPALSRDASGHHPQVGRLTPASSGFPAAAVGEGPSRDASHLERCQVPTSGWASRDTWAPALSPAQDCAPSPPPLAQTRSLTP